MYKLILFANTTLRGKKEGLYDITYHFVFCITGFDTFLLSGCGKRSVFPAAFRPGTAGVSCTLEKRAWTGVGIFFHVNDPHKKAAARKSTLPFWLRGFWSYNNAHQPAFAVVDDFLHGILELCLAFLADGGQLASDTVLHQLFYRFSENIGLPDALSS